MLTLPSAWRDSSLLPILTPNSFSIASTSSSASIESRPKRGEPMSGSSSGISSGRTPSSLSVATIRVLRRSVRESDMGKSGGAAEQVADVAAAEAAAVVEHEARGLVERGARQVEAGAHGIGFLEMGGAGNEAVVDRQRAEGGLHRAGERQAVAGERLGAADARLGAGRGEHGVQGERLRAVARGGGGGVGVDVVDVGRVHAGVGERAPHGLAQAGALGMRDGDAVAVAGLAPAGQFGVDVRAALPGERRVLDDRAPTAPPVPTNPSRRRSKGREAVAGSGLLERARRLENETMLSAVMSSAPTTSIRCCRPRRISSMA